MRLQRDELTLRVESDPEQRTPPAGADAGQRRRVGQRLGVKAGDGQLVPAGSIIVRQRGMTFLSGPGTGLGKDYTVFATTTGKVVFEHATRTKKRIRVEAVEATAPSA
jgi:large subunit ribosomal protein L27